MIFAAAFVHGKQSFVQDVVLAMRPGKLAALTPSKIGWAKTI
jgi:hypothetical protein